MDPVTDLDTVQSSSCFSPPPTRSISFSFLLHAARLQWRCSTRRRGAAAAQEEGGGVEKT